MHVVVVKTINTEYKQQTTRCKFYCRKFKTTTVHAYILHISLL